MEVNLILFCERLKRVLAGEEGTLMLPDSTNLPPLFQNLLTESEIISTTLLGNYQVDMIPLLATLFAGIDIHRPDIAGILKDINYLVHESEKAIDAIFITIMQQQQNSQTGSTAACNELCDALLELQYKIIDIGNRMQQLPPSCHDFDSNVARDNIIQHGISLRSEINNDMSELERGREELIDLLIEGQPRLSVVAILDSIDVDKTAFAAETYNNNHVKFYFDCHAWIRVSFHSNFGKVLDDIIMSLMPASSWGEIMGKDYESKNTILRDYLTNKRYFIVLDDVWFNDIWDNLREALPDNQNGSRVMVTVGDPIILTSLELENGEEIRIDSVLVGGPLIRIKLEGWQFFILHYGSSPLKNLIGQTMAHPIGLKLLSLLELPFYLKVCCLYLCVFPQNTEITTRQLHQLWTAEGLIADNYNSEEMAEEYLKELCNRGFIQVTKKGAGGTIKAFHVQTFVLATLFRVDEVIEFIELIDSGKEAHSLETIKRFSIFRNLTDFVSLEHSDSCIHTLLNMTESDRPAVVDCMEICKKFKHLKVLNLGSSVLDEYPTGIENLFLLRYLRLNIPSLKSLPSSLCNLRNLYTLDMPSSYVDNAPEDIWKMHKLTHLNFGCITLPAPPTNYSSSLENLIFISALHPSSCTPDALGRLPNVQTLRISGDLSYYQYGLSKSLCQLHKLKCLKLVNGTKTSQRSQMILSEYQFPPSLTQLSISNTELMEDPMPTLEKLPLLEVLKLKQNSYFGRKLACVGSCSFPQLKILHLKSMLWLEEWTMGAEAMLKLESLIVSPCAYLRKLPEELWCIKKLCKLELHWPQPELRQRLRAFEDMEWRYDIQIYPYGI